MSSFLIGYSRGSNIKGKIEIKKKLADENLKGRWCVYRSEAGDDLAKIICIDERNGHCPEMAKKLGEFVRYVSNADLERIKHMKEYETNSEKICLDFIKRHSLPMKIVKTTLSFDERRLTFYFVADERVDFRGLVKDLVAHFHKMIRLQQIGPRDHARIVNGIGICGRELCCAKFLNEVGKITKDTATMQGMEELSSDKISGVCGKLMCCLRYEIEGYENNQETTITKLRTKKTKNIS